MQSDRAHTLARIAFAPLRLAARALPAGLLQRLEDRVFYAIFQMTRVENDAYPKRDLRGDPGPTPGSE